VKIGVSDKLREKHRFRLFENKLLRRIFQPKRDEVTGSSRKFCIEDLHNLNIIRMF
jgi:hypothetical protein